MFCAWGILGPVVRDGDFPSEFEEDSNLRIGNRYRTDIKPATSDLQTPAQQTRSSGPGATFYSANGAIDVNPAG